MAETVITVCSLTSSSRMSVEFITDNWSHRLPYVITRPVKFFTLRIRTDRPERIV